MSPFQERLVVSPFSFPDLQLQGSGETELDVDAALGFSGREGRGWRSPGVDLGQLPGAGALTLGFSGYVGAHRQTSWQTARLRKQCE